jgi:hypothetical protein
MATVPQLAEQLGSDRYTRKTLADGSGVLLDLEGMRVLSLNATGAFLLDRIAAGAGSAGALAAELAAAFEVDQETARQDVEELLADLEKALSRGGSGG